MTEQEPGGTSSYFYFALVSATDWGDVTSSHPAAGEALKSVYEQLLGADAIVMSNGAKDDDAYILQLARLAGVSARVVNLGAITAGYMSRRFKGATALVAPSHYVAHNPAVIHNSPGLPVKVCHPVMDASRVIAGARSCASPPAGIEPGVPTVSLLNDTGEENAAACAWGDGMCGHGLTAKFIMIGRLSPYKAPGMFVRAMSLLRKRTSGIVPDEALEAVLVGTGPLRRHLEQLVLESDALVRFTGLLAVDKVPCEVVGATALILPSLSLETFGMVAPEAMILGVPVITFGFGGTAELVRHMENGIVVDEPTPRALANAMEMLARDRGLRDRLGAQARLDARRAMFLPDMVKCHADTLSPASNLRGW